MMTQSEFFSGIENNLRRLTEARIPLPDYNLPGVLRGNGHQQVLRNLMKTKELKKLTAKDPNAPVNVRVYDLVSGALPGVQKQKFRVFAAFVDSATRDEYKHVKFIIRKWYQESGWADATDKPYAGALVVGSTQAWPDGMMPNSDDMPFAQVAFQVLSSPCADPKQGLNLVFSGDQEKGAVIFRALGEDFESQKRRVTEYVEKLFSLPEIAREGHIFVEDVAEATHVPADDVSNIFNDLQGEGRLTIRKSSVRTRGASKSKAATMYVVPGPAPHWKQLVSRKHGAWYTKSGFCTALSVSTIGYLAYLVFNGLKSFVSDFVSGDAAILLYVVAGLTAMGCFLLALKFIFRNR